MVSERSLRQLSEEKRYTFKDVVQALEGELRNVRSEIAALRSHLASEPPEPPPDSVPDLPAVLAQLDEQPSPPAPTAEHATTERPLTPGVPAAVEQPTRREKAPRVVYTGTIQGQPTFHHSRKRGMLIAELSIVLKADEQSPPREVTAGLYGPKAERLRGQELAGKAAKLIGGIAKEREVLNPDGTKQTRVEINGYALATQ